MARPMIHHRAPEFSINCLPRFVGDLKWLFQTRNDVLILAASGTGGMKGRFQISPWRQSPDDQRRQVR